VDGAKVNTSPQLQEIIARHKPGDRVTLKIRRHGADKMIPIELKNREGKTDMHVRERNEVFNTLGAEFEVIDPKTADKLDIDGGVKVSKLYPGKLRQQTDMRPGFIITAIDGKPVKKVEDVENALAKKEGGVLIEGVYEDTPGKMYYGFGM
ncbi:MAG TPA: PDZ domain-containing protein, partial [Cyclobacteriaceae bacterium]|nr:PDZ domain-containing protein [Cyclobacteriaceae bacterium]